MFSDHLLVAFSQEHKLMSIIGIINQHVTIEGMPALPKTTFCSFIEVCSRSFLRQAKPKV